MPIYRMDNTGRFVPFEEAAPELERQLEDWIEQNPHLLLEGETLAVIGRQTATAFGKALDLLAVDQSGAIVVIELKKGLPPRDVVAQALEYTAWVDSLSLDDLDAIARQYASLKLAEVAGVATLYDQTFGNPSEEGQEDEEGIDASSRVTFNARQRIVIVAEAYPGEMEQTLRYLRGRLGVDVSAVQFTVHKLDQDTLLDTEVVVGREPVGSVKVAGATSRPIESHEQIRDKVVSDFLREQIEGLETWIAEQKPGLRVEHHKGSLHSIYLTRQWVGGYYFATNWIHFWLGGRVPGDEDDLVTLSIPSSVLIKSDRIVGNMATEADLTVYKRQFAQRIAVL